MSFTTHNWMNYVSSKKKLSELTVPGTHDTGSWPLDGLYQCQTMNLARQLASGIRFLDIRLKPSGTDGEFQLWHGGGNAELSFRTDIVSICETFLAQSPSEVIIMSVKDERKPGDRKTEVSEGDAQKRREFYSKLQSNINQYPHLFYTQDRIPRLYEVRGKIVVLRQFWASGTLGIDAFAEWPEGGNFKNGTSSWVNHAGVKLTVQDKFSGFLSVRKGDKFSDHVLPLLQEARSNQDRLFINFTSGVLDGGGSPAFPPLSLAKKANSSLPSSWQKIHRPVTVLYPWITLS